MSAEETAVAVDEVMKKYDRESNTRIWEGTPKLIIRVLMAAFSVFCIISTLYGNSFMLVQQKLTSFVGLGLLIGFLIYPVKKGVTKVNYMPWYDIVIMILGSGAFLYYTFNANAIIDRSVNILPYEIIIGLIGILALAELCRRSVGLPILFVAAFFVLYAFISGFDFKYVVYKLFYADTGILTTPISVCSKFIVVFIIFGAFLEKTGIADMFIEFANCIAGSASGGPAKVAVIASALEGMVSGSSVANTVGSGSVTIPMMKRTGYKPEFAGAVEAAASTGGQIMPPIMGAAAFLMADYIGVGYSNIIVKAILPAALYFLGIFFAVHLEAKKLGLKGLSKEELPLFRHLIKKSYLLLPIVVLLYLISSGTRTIQTAATISIFVAIFVSLFNKGNRINFKRIFEALETGAKNTISIIAACGIAGIIAGTITMTGLASVIINGIITLSGDTQIIALVLTMICCIVLGMGVPTTANYCIMATTCAPILITLGIPKIAAHFFVFYFGIVADITPPVALAAYAGAAIAKAKPMQTALNATKLAIAAFIIPYMFALNPAMLFIDTNAFDVILICITSIVGLFGVSAALEGYITAPMSWYERFASAIGGLLLIYPGIITDVVGVVLVAMAIILQTIRAKKGLPIPE